MALVLLLLLFVVIGFVVAGAVTWREYQRAYAAGHRDVPPLTAWMYRRDPDPDVEGARRTALFATLASIVAIGVFGAVLYAFPVV